MCIDAAEQEIECPIKKQKFYYSGKKRYTMKTQLLVSSESKMIYEITSSKGKTHDFKMFKDSKTHIPSDIIILLVIQVIKG